MQNLMSYDILVGGISSLNYQSAVDAQFDVFKFAMEVTTVTTVITEVSK